MLPEHFDAIAREDAEDVALVVIELIRGRPAKVQQILAEEVSDACKTEMSQLLSLIHISEPTRPY